MLPVRFGFTVSDLLRDADGRVSGVIGTDHYGRTTAIRARFVVGADGINSLVATRVGAPLEKTGRGASSYLYRYWSDVTTDGYEWVFRPGATAGVVPTNDGLTCVFVGSDLQRIASRAPDSYAELLSQASPDVAARVLSGSGAGPRPPIPRTARLGASPMGPRLGAGRRRGVLEGPDQRARDHRRAARRRAGSERHRRRDRRARRPLAHWMETDRDLRNQMSSDLFDVTDRIASGDWTDDDIPVLLVSRSAAMADEVGYLAGLAHWPRAAVTAGVGCG